MSDPSLQMRIKNMREICLLTSRYLEEIMKRVSFLRPNWQIRIKSMLSIVALMGQDLEETLGPYLHSDTDTTKTEVKDAENKDVDPATNLPRRKGGWLDIDGNPT